MTTLALTISLSVLGAVLTFCLVALSGRTDRARREVTRFLASPLEAVRRKCELDAVEKAVFDKADRICEMADRESKIISLGHPPPPAPATAAPLTGEENETASMKAVTKKVLRIKNLSDRI